MPGTEQDANAPARLRSLAEEKVRQQSQGPADFAPEQMSATLHELRVHQVELEMQNEQLRATQVELEQARERLVELYDFAPVGYLTLSRQGLILGANLTSVGMFGVDRTNLLTLPFSRFVHPGDQDAYYRWFRCVFAKPDDVHACELRLRPPARAGFTARLEGIQAMDADHPICRLTVSDITAQKQAEEALRERERRRLEHENDERMRMALEAGGLGTWDHDLLSGQITCSERASAILGFPLGAPVAWDALLARIHLDDRASFLSAVDSSVDPGGGGRIDAVFRIVLPAGATRWLRFVAQCFFVPPGRRAVRRTGVLADITRQREVEDLLQCRAKHLETLVDERTGRLRDAVAELEHFSYTLAHDLRAPLRAIRGYSQILLAESNNLNSREQEFLERSDAAAERMDGLIVDALNYNRLVSQEFPLVNVDCARLLHQLIESYPQFQEARNCISIQGHFPPVLGNPALLTQCFSNLLTNALKFVAPGKNPAVQLSAEERGSRVRIWVHDNGIGIPDHCRERIFQMFERLDQSYEGTGIGLSLVKKAVSRMGGAVGVESQPGQGSRFWLELNRSATQSELVS